MSDNQCSTVNYNFIFHFTYTNVFPSIMDCEWIVLNVDFTYKSFKLIIIKYIYIFIVKYFAIIFI